MKKIAIYKNDLQQALTELTAAMQEKNWFVNIQTAPPQRPPKNLGYHWITNTPPPTSDVLR